MIMAEKNRIGLVSTIPIRDPMMSIARLRSSCSGVNARFLQNRTENEGLSQNV